jgi:YidC/Oxa1 family membrane protein insertase
MWDLILNPFITVITLLYSVLANNAVLAIIVFTVLVRLLMYPLSMQQLRSSKEMQKLQPELKKLQEKYKNDREKLAQEQMRLYKEHGVNPFGGCLPLLIQLPIWIGLYQAINHALAATPLQLLDLSGRFLVSGLDRLVPLNNVVAGIDLTQPPTANPTIALALPVLVLVTSYVQSKMITPAQPPREDGKPDQAAAMTQSMTTVMPIMMGMFSLSFSVGLSIYFIVSNLISIIQYSGQADWRKVIGLPSKKVEEPAKIVESTARPTSKKKTDAIDAKTSSVNGSKSPRTAKKKGAADKPTEI